MKIEINDNTGYIKFTENPIAESSNISDRLVADYDAKNNIVGIEILDIAGVVNLELSDRDKNQLISILNG